MIDNLEIIKPLFNFEREGDFYMLYVFKRKKDQATDKSNHQSVRTIKTYCIESIDYLENHYDEIKQLCEMFYARAYIHVQKQNHQDVSLNMLVSLANKIQNGQHNQQYLFNSVVGEMKTYEKRWIIDIDSKDTKELLEIQQHIDHCRPHGEDKIESIIPTKNGFHLITKRFDVIEFKNKYPHIDIQKKNPTLLYLPNILHY